MAANEVARVYASALLDIGQERKILSQLEEELAFISKLLDDDRELALFFNAPGVTKDSKKAFVDRVFKGDLSDISINFLKTLIDNNRQLSIKDIHEALIGLIDELNNQSRHDRITAPARSFSVMSPTCGMKPSSRTHSARPICSMAR